MVCLQPCWESVGTQARCLSEDSVSWVKLRRKWTRWIPQPKCELSLPLAALRRKKHIRSNPGPWKITGALSVKLTLCSQDTRTWCKCCRTECSWWGSNLDPSWLRVIAIKDFSRVPVVKHGNGKYCVASTLIRNYALLQNHSKLE